MTPTTSPSGCDPLDAELSLAIAAALASGTHRDHDLLILHERLREVEQIGTMPGAGAGSLEAAQEAPDGPTDRHVIVSAFLDALAQAQLLPVEQPSRPQ